jgi:glycine/D-amino acid oxidase-like deaminating enzyme
LGISIPQLSVRATVAATAPMPEVIAGAAADSQLAWRRRRDGGYTLAPAAFHEFMIGPDAVRHFGSFIKLFLKEPFQTALLPKSPKGYPDAWGTARKWASEANPFEDMPVLNPAPHKRTVAKMASQFSEIFPQLGKTQIKTSWAGMIDTMPDVVPVVDRAEALPGLVIATGMCGHGFGIGPAFGRITADLVMENAVGHDLHRFRLSRFSDGSRLAAGPAL